MLFFKETSVLLLVILDIASLHVHAEGIRTREKIPFKRRVRRVPSNSQTPYPVDCQLSQWSQWSSCYACQEKMHRYRTLLQPSKYGGRICSGYPWSEDVCKPTGQCASDQQCGADFQCKESGRCIKQTLRCNGENDCLDLSDEDGCGEVLNENFCKDLFPIPGSENAVLGFNVLTQERGESVFDPKFFGGQCEYVYNGEWRDLKYDPTCERLYYGDDEKYFRKPFNFHLYKFLAHADSGMSSEFYEDTTDLLNAIKRGSSFNFGFTFGISPPASPVGLEFGFNMDASSSNLKKITKYDSKNVGFVRVHTKVQTARFKMRKTGIVLNEDFLQSLMDLPDQYNYGMYAKFINDYGTHFVSSGTMGGVFEYIMVVNKEYMRRTAISSTSFAFCAGVSLGLKMTNEDETVEGSLSVSYKGCDKVGSFYSDSKERSAAIEDVISLVRGGDTASTGGITSFADANMYRLWGRSLKYNPTVIDFEIQPIHELLTRSNLKNIEAKQQNLKRALDEYLIEFNACRCGPCQNNGEPVLIGSDCQCLCPNGFEGVACEVTTRTGTKVNGSWSCWSPWSQCQSRTRTRRRECNNPGPKDGGAWCIGKAVQTEVC